MDANRFDRFARVLTPTPTRRNFGRSLTGLALGGALGSLFGRAETEAGRRKKKRKRKQDLCLNDGSRCTKESKNCSATFCLKTPFTIEARWSNPDTDHDTNVFVPNAPGAALSSPYIDYNSGSSCTNSGTVYPFAFVSQDATSPGDEVTTVKRLLAGAYEYWIELAESSPPRELTVTLRNANGKVVRSWLSPANPSVQVGWHVFDIEGASKRITSIDLVIDSDLADGAHAPNTDVCA